MTDNNNSVADIHKFSVVHPNAKLGKNVKIGNNVKFILSIAPDGEKPADENFDEGKNREIVIEDDVTIGNNVVIKSGCVINKRTTILDNTDNC